jgi:hypothetical protein
VFGGVFALLAYPRMFAPTRRVILERGVRVYIYAMALITVGALLVRDGAGGVASSRIKAAGAQSIFGAEDGPAKGNSAPRATPRPRRLGRRAAR